MYIWYINICTVVTLYSIKMVYKEERKFYEERKIRLPPWIPYITGQYGGAAFVLIYLLFLLILGLPIMVMEFSVGRASRSSVALSFDRLEPLGT